MEALILFIIITLVVIIVGTIVGKAPHWKSVQRLVREDRLRNEWVAKNRK
jgi:hypothetical protein